MLETRVVDQHGSSAVNSSYHMAQ